MEADRPRWLTLIGFWAAGLIAGIATCISIRWLALVVGDNLFYFLGAVFGIFLSLYLWLFHQQRSVIRVLIFTAVSAAAYYAAFCAGVSAISGELSIHIPLLGIDPQEVPIMIVGGLAGAFIVFLAFYFLFARIESRTRILAKLGIAVLSSAVLGVVGWALWSSVGSAVWTLLLILRLGSPREAVLQAAPKDTAQSYSLYVVWQSGFALLLGLLCPLRARPNSSDSAET